MNKLRALLVCHVSPGIGIGHLSRLLALAQELKKDNKVIPEFLIFGVPVKKNELSDFNVHTFSISSDLVATIELLLEEVFFDTLIFDLHQNNIPYNVGQLFLDLKQRDICLISIDSLIEHCDILDLVWIPSFNFDCGRYREYTAVLKSGWDSFLIQKRLKDEVWTPGTKVLILTGGSDISNLRKTLPTQLDGVLRDNTEVHWVRGPFSGMLNLPKKCRLKWIVHNSPDQLDDLIVECDYVITVFGVSFFEVLQYGRPTVVFSPYGNKDNKELEALSKEGVALVAHNPNEAINGLIQLMNNDEIANVYAKVALGKMSINGAQILSKAVHSLKGSK